MTELQMGLIGLGGAAIVGIVAYNAWQDFRQRKLAEQILKGKHADVLLDAVDEGAADEADARRPTLGDAPVFTAGEAAAPLLAELPPADRAETLPGERLEPVLRFEPEESEPEEPEEPLRAQRAPLATEPAPPPVVATTLDSDEKVTRSERAERAEKAEKNGERAEVEALLSPLIDYVGTLESAAPIAGAQIAALQQSTLARVGKAVHWIGYNEGLREWETIAGVNGNAYRALRVGLQLADRRGPVAAGELATFQSGLRALADQFDASVDLPSAQDAVDSALALDAFCAGVDIQIGLNVVSGALVFPGTKLRALAEAAGMVIDAEGRFVRCDDDGNVLYVLVNQEAAGFAVDSMKSLSTHGVTFVLDVPRVAHGDRVFNQMVDLAKRFADVLHGALVDDNRRPLSDGALEPIRRQIAQYQAQMVAEHIAPGGAVAQRLFS